MTRCPNCGEVMKCPVCDQRLTPMELRVLETLAVDGATDLEIALRLGLSRYTVKTHMGTIMRKFRSHNRTELILRALRAGVIALESEEVAI